MSEKSNYLEIVFSNINTEKTDILIAMLSELSFTGFDETGENLKAYILEDEWNETEVRKLSEQFEVPFGIAKIPIQNWNAVWESNFEPVVIDDFVAVRAHFHLPIAGVAHEIVITPKMSFGTGHHATTTMMMQQMRQLNFANAQVFDFGAGTGILSILAEKLGAKQVIAIDNDAWSIENSIENIERNYCERIHVELKNDADVKQSFDIILANINKNIILQNFSFLFEQLNKNGYLLLSGLLAEDEEAILAQAIQYQLQHVNTRHLSQWISILFSR